MAAPERSGSTEPKAKRRKTGSAPQSDGKAAQKCEVSDNEDEVGKDDKAGSGAEDEKPTPVPAGLAGWKGFCTAFGSIMGRTLDKPDAPVLCETEAEQKIMEAKKAMKEQRLHRLQSQGVKNKGHTLPDITKKPFEAQLRKVATEGVVRLFNAMKDYRDQQLGLSEKAKAKARAAPMREKSKLMADFQKEAFEDKWNRRSIAKQERQRKEAKDAEELEKQRRNTPKEIRLQRIAAREARKAETKPRELQPLEEFE